MILSLRKRLTTDTNDLTTLTSYSKRERLPVILYNYIYIFKSAFQSHPFCCTHFCLKTLKSWTTLFQENLCLGTDLGIQVHL